MHAQFSEYSVVWYEFHGDFIATVSFRDIEDLDLLQTNLRIDYKMALEMTYGILILEVIHRVIVCIFEVRRSSGITVRCFVEICLLNSKLLDYTFTCSSFLHKIIISLTKMRFAIPFVKYFRPSGFNTASTASSGAPLPASTWWACGWFSAEV